MPASERCRGRKSAGVRAMSASRRFCVGAMWDRSDNGVRPMSEWHRCVSERCLYHGDAGVASMALLKRYRVLRRCRSPRSGAIAARLAFQRVMRPSSSLLGYFESRFASCLQVTSPRCRRHTPSCGRGPIGLSLPAGSSEIACCIESGRVHLIRQRFLMRDQIRSLLRNILLGDSCCCSDSCCRRRTRWLRGSPC
jgi:hypothetical protein